MPNRSVAARAAGSSLVAGRAGTITRMDERTMGRRGWMLLGGGALLWAAVPVVTRVPALMVVVILAGWWSACLGTAWLWRPRYDSEDAWKKRAVVPVAVWALVVPVLGLVLVLTAW